MGCSGSSSARGLDGTGAKKWLQLEDLAASVQAVPRKDGKKGLTVLVAGMDKYGLIGTLENAFRQKGLGIEAGDWDLQGSLFHASFHLYPVNQENTVTKSNGTVMKLRTELCTMEDNSKSAAPEQAASSGKALPKKAALSYLKVDIEHTMAEELHVGLLKIVHEFGGHTVRGALCRVSSTENSPGSARCAGGLPQAQHDVFWIDCFDKAGLIDATLSSPDVLQKQLRSTRAALEEEVEPSRQITPEVPMQSVNTKTTDSLLNALRLADQEALKKLVLDLPVAVMDHVRDTPYAINPTAWGHQLEGFQKYMGAGITLVNEGESSGSQAPVVQFTTLLVQHKNVNRMGTQNIIKRSLASLQTRQYGEFVSSIDLNRQRFTVEKAFLNKVCPAGQNTGSVIVSEHLWAPVWEKGVLGLGDLLPVHKVQEIKLSDVVNWNTYAVMSTALTERGALNDMYGPHFQGALDQEIQAAGLTRDALKSRPLVDILLHTSLGKLIQRVLVLWCERTSVSLKCTKAEVTFRSNGSERIAGEVRAVMDVVCDVQVEYVSSLGVKSGGTAAAVVESVVPAEAAPGTPAEAALHEWLKQMKAGQVEYSTAKPERQSTTKTTSSEADHGFFLQKVCVHTRVHDREALLAVTRGVHALQQERAWSCLAVADGLDEQTAARLNTQRSATDDALVAALQLTTSRALRAVSTSLILLRGVVDQNLGSTGSWKERYKLICEEPRAFHILVGTLVEWLVTACKMNPDISDSSAESIGLFVYFREQLGRERSFVLSRGSARPADPLSDEEGMRNVVLMSATRNLIGDLIQVNARFAAVFRQLDEAEARFMADTAHDPQNWFSVTTACIDLVGRLIDGLISDDNPEISDEKQEPRLLQCANGEGLQGVLDKNGKVEKVSM